MPSKQRVVVVGNGMVGHHFVQQLVTQQGDRKNIAITVLSGEDRLAYDRVQLSSFFKGKTEDDLALTSNKTYQVWQVSFHTHSKVVDINREEKTVTTSKGESFAYDKLILATGSYAFVPPIPGKDREHCLVYRTINDLHAIKKSAHASKVGVVIGGGLLGLEAANALKQLGLQTHVIEFAPQLMGVQIDGAGGRLLKNKITDLGVTVHTSVATEQIIEGENSRYKMCFKGGQTLETDMIVFSAGIRPYDNLAREFNLEIGERGGIVINNHCQTSDENIYAIGECALWNNFIFGLVAPGYAMAKVAAGHVLNHSSSIDVDEFSGADMSTKLKLMGVEVGSIGDAHARTEGAISYYFEDQPNGIYKKIVTNEQGNKLIGAVLVGDTSEYDNLLQYHLNNIELSVPAESLIMPLAGDAGELSADDLPRDAIICACHKVTKHTIEQAVMQGCSDLNAVQHATKASTGCGGCEKLVQSVISSALKNKIATLNPVNEPVSQSA
ncbi:FAD-dependent oxidoreductase [Pseudoalteromonas sp. P1-25]|uniref:FAD-dependent oxidoreductase n=1 Tax=Pseudoalteromonas sp. P1-25 TaxID=1723758 RepID=UPI0006E635E1|nr:FAD-dependent oxidoreductase [Pseudoalteromonas sp. P1-25]KPZ55614.1 Nitrite reductase [NAD(P)H] [Pseudoalteromonas sp. P1-25]